MMSCDSTWATVSIATPTTISSDVPPKKNVTPRPWVNHCGITASNCSPTNGIGATRKPGDAIGLDVHVNDNDGTGREDKLMWSDSVDLAHGDLLLMAGAAQQHYVHAVPKTARPVGERVNLTLRWVSPDR